MIYLLTREGRSYTDEGLLGIKSTIKDLYGDDSNMLVNMGAYLNKHENIITALERNDGSGYLVISMPVGGGFFTGKDELAAAAELIRRNPDKNPWETMAYVVATKHPGEHAYTPPREINH